MFRYAGYCYMWDELKANKGSIEVSSCLKKFILTEIPSIAEVLNLYADNCPEVGHTYQEADGVHSCINAAAKGENIYSPEDWLRVVKHAKKDGRPYHVQEMCQEHFRDYRAYRDKAGLNEKMKFADGSEVSWRNLRVIQLRKNSPRTIFVKGDYDDEFQEISIKRDFPRAEPQRKYHSPLAISKAKWQDLKGMCKAHIITAEYHDFYKTLPHIDNLTGGDSDPEIFDGRGIMPGITRSRK